MQESGVLHPQNTLQPNPMHNPQHKPIMRKMESKNNTWFTVLGSIIVVLAGVGTGWVLSGGANATSSPSVSQEQQQAVTQSANEAGLQDTSSFEKEAPIGKLVEGGIDGDGTHHLEREGGPSQYVYLTSTVIDLASFEGKTVQVWGNSLAGKKAGWLMDVGKVKVVE